MNFAKLICIVAVSLLVCTALPAQDHADAIPVIDASKAFGEIAALPRHIREASGLATTDQKTFWTHNDGGVPILFNIDSTGRVVKSIQLNHPNAGWEDLATDKKGNLYVGGFGNNNNDKKKLKIYKINNPDGITEKVYTAEIIHFRYSDQHTFPPAPAQRNFDMDAMIALGSELYLFSKNRTEPFTGYTKIYRLPQTPGEHVATPVDSIYLGSGPM
ncbi:MAG TPA: hypothetical protein VEB86_16540, partial [Chryseosolibacter sp.]|nr:hypothetical protein [Chryseosolibacter sp.]